LFLERLQSVVDRMKRHPHEAAAVLFIDIDDFKVVNDCYGHAIGDALIKEVSNRLRACLRSDGTIARMGGDEFTVLVEDVTDPSDVIRVAERIQSSFERPFLLEGLEVVKSASIGIALTSPETSAEAVLDPPLYVSINISSRHFSHAGFIGHVKDALEESAIDPQCITIELTESLAMNDVAATFQTMSQLRTLGVKLSIDDFGTGYSSLSYLRRFPVDTLKIDQSFVKTMDAENYAIVKTIIGLARNLELKVVAEGVETPNQHQLLALAGCGSAQGYLFAEPMPANSVGVFIESNRRNSGQTKQRGLARSTAGL
jgi:diguanylate cyclase (GGDEF)-like protein